MTVERRTFRNVEVRASEQRGPNGRPVVSLRIIKPGAIDDYGSLWMADTFDGALLTRIAADPDDTPALCWSHDWSDPIGHGIRYQPDAGGPFMDFELDDFDAVPRARQADAQVRSKTIRDCSVGFVAISRRAPTETEMRTYPGIREVIEEADLDEVSLVLRGAVPGAKVTGIRAKRAGATVDLEALLEIARKRAADEITQEEAQVAVDLLLIDDTAPVADPPAEEPPVDDETGAEAMDAEIDAALDGLLSRSARGVRFPDRYASEVDRMLRDALTQALDPEPNQWLWVRDHTDTEVVFGLENFGDRSGTWRQSYAIDGNTIRFDGEAERVVEKITFQKA